MESDDYQKIRTRIFFGLLLGVTALTVYIVLPFLSPLVWAAVLASLFYPLYSWTLKKTRRENTSALITVSAVVLMVLIPVLLITSLLVKEALDFYSYLNRPGTIESVVSFIDQYGDEGLVGEVIQNLELSERVRNSLSTIAGALLSAVRQGSASTLAFAAKVFLMLYVLFFLLRDGKKLLLKIQRLLPLGDRNEERLYNQFSSTARATLKGSVLLSVIQGLFAGLGLFIVGFPAVISLTILAIIFALIPAVGPSFILVPAAAYLFFTGPIWQPILLLLVAFVIAASDNILRPILVEGDIEMHPAVFLFATLGGIAVFGVSGIVFGPIVMALFQTMMGMYEDKYKRHIDAESLSEENS